MWVSSTASCGGRAGRCLVMELHTSSAPLARIFHAIIEERRNDPHLSSWAHGVQGVGVEGGVTMSKVRPATPTVAFIDQYCAQYRDLFQNVRHFEQFTALHLGLLAETLHKSLPRLGTTVHADPQALHHFLANADWSVEAVRAKRLELLRQALGDMP